MREDPRTGRAFPAEGTARAQVLRQEQTWPVQATARGKDRASGVVVGAGLSCEGILGGSDSRRAVSVGVRKPACQVS